MQIVFKGLPIHYQIKGEGLPLVFLHGFNENITIWNEVISTLSNAFKCIVIDLPGFGKSPLPSNLTIGYLSDAVMRVIREEKLSKPIVIGHSMGGYVVAQMVLDYENEMAAAALFHSSARKDSAEKLENRTKTLEFLKNNPVEAFFKVFVEGLFAAPNRRSQFLNRANSIIGNTGVASVEAGLTAMMNRPDRLEVLKNSNLPWLFICGKHDAHLPLSDLAYQASLTKKSMFEILENSGHLGMIEEPEKSTEIMINFAKWVNQIQPN